ncbi:hypothetical protein [Cohaesibacter haloalkalitolerans]|uniref:hypothetical protein n=1 Tax=Cohaesibacter haloalkalitolerans TaxID=1162980 RepID=UPI000E655D34|nr:hypothetical protein [Cohaesibacter haloalkalitolerans]
MIRFAIFFLKITFFVPLFCLLFGYLLSVAWPYMYTESEQDTCSFGTVSNEKYREYLSEMKWRALWEWPPLSEEVDVYAGQIPRKGSLIYRLNSALQEAEGFYEQLAIAHAVMRASGMRLRERKPLVNGKYSRDWMLKPYYEEGYAFYKLAYSYEFTTLSDALFPLRMFKFDQKSFIAFLGSEARIKSGPGRTANGLIEVTVGDKDLFMNGPPPGESYFPLFPTFTDYENAYQRCPTVPSEAWVEAYERALEPMANKNASR